MWKVEAEDKIYRYIRGKVSISLLVATCDAFILWAVGLRDGLFLVFAVLIFWVSTSGYEPIVPLLADERVLESRFSQLNFVPNVGMAIGVILPMPLVLLDPHFGPISILVTFLAPLAVGLVAKDILEPLLIGEATSLTPGECLARSPIESLDFRWVIQDLNLRPLPCLTQARDGELLRGRTLESRPAQSPCCSPSCSGGPCGA